VSQEPAPSLRARPDGTVAAVIIATCAVVAILAVAQHPVAASHAAAQAIPEMVRLAPMDRTIHGILIAVMAALLFGFSVFSARVGFDRQTTIAGLTAYALGVGAVIGAGLIDGFIVPDIALRYVGVSPGDIKSAVPLLHLCSIAIQNLTKFGFIAMSAAIAAWSLGLVSSAGVRRATGVVGFCSAGLTIAILAYAHTLNPHFLVIIVFVQAIWYLAIAALLLRRLV
jgi:hypothetical protein